MYYRLGHTLCVGLCVVLWRVDYIYKALSCCLHTRLEFSTPSPIVYRYKGNQHARDRREQTEGRLLYNSRGVASIY